MNRTKRRQAGKWFYAFIFTSNARWFYLEKIIKPVAIAIVNVVIVFHCVEVRVHGLVGLQGRRRSEQVQHLLVLHSLPIEFYDPITSRKSLEK